MEDYIGSIIVAADIDKLEEKIDSKEIIKGQEEICQFTKDILKVMAKSYMKRPSLSHSEIVYNTNMVFPCLQAIATMMKKSEYMPYFVPGEEELVAMTVQLKEMGYKEDKRKIYRADGVLRLAKFSDLEVLVLETAGAFGYNDKAKIAFDNSKGMFALLAMLKTVADTFKYASADEFRKLKLYLVQPSGKQ
ncbi:uncharacterized protein BX663DRAFT_530525 [Cokeromyces recurvatus]|uniref:uncharacterized protein n=1 Tax=Cokeromyces recurvatus TaxID=90255 RepID=UPI00221E49BE|nr:uncharacterized protein BX663DRAFT_530525 [Cokeromyces recurvatus]KAI7903809.1 hypothetical protein BX663DRAFT_530525 [Cokeromyces recurvatus]